MKKLFSIIIVVLPVVLIAQSAERQVIGSAGNFTSATGLQVSNTVGETITTTGSSTSLILTQGFQQPNTSPLAIEDVKLGYVIKAYPNPAHNAVTLDFTTQKSLLLQISLFDIYGKQIQPTEQLNINGNIVHTVNVSAIPSGNYFIHLTNTDGKLNKNIPFQKID